MSGPGAVEYQREQHRCTDCRAVTVHVRAVRVVTNWHSDWTCIHAVSGDGCEPGTAPVPGNVVTCPHCRQELPAYRDGHGVPKHTFQAESGRETWTANCPGSFLPVKGRRPVAGTKAGRHNAHSRTPTDPPPVVACETEGPPRRTPGGGVSFRLRRVPVAVSADPDPEVM